MEGGRNAIQSFLSDRISCTTSEQSRTNGRIAEWRRARMPIMNHDDLRFTAEQRLASDEDLSAIGYFLLERKLALPINRLLFTHCPNLPLQPQLVPSAGHSTTPKCILSSRAVKESWETPCLLPEEAPNPRSCNRRRPSTDTTAWLQRGRLSGNYEHRSRLQGLRSRTRTTSVHRMHTCFLLVCSLFS